MIELLSIKSMDGDFTKFAYYLEITKKTSKSIYAEGISGVYRVELKTGKVFYDGELIANSCTYKII